MTSLNYKTHQKSTSENINLIREEFNQFRMNLWRRVKVLIREEFNQFRMNLWRRVKVLIREEFNQFRMNLWRRVKVLIREEFNQFRMNLWPRENNWSAMNLDMIKLGLPVTRKRR